MFSLVEQVENHLERIRSLIPSNTSVKEYLRQVLDDQIASVSKRASMGIVPSSLLSSTQVYASARMAVELVDNPLRLAGKPEGIVDLGIIEWVLRPALPLRDGSIQHIVSGPWQSLSTDTITRLARSVCRLDIVVERCMPIHIGTGFIVGKDRYERAVVMTNAHVVEEAARYGWPDTAGLMFMCDFERYTTAEPPEHLFPLANEYHIHPHYDLALVYLDQGHTKDTNIPSAPLALSTSSPEPLIGFTIGVLGHPSFNSNIDSFPKYFGFGEEFGIKRFSPGHIRIIEHRYWRHQNIDVFLHDATTLSGSSGSCILDLNDMKVVGLHFGGWPKNPQLVKVSSQNVLAQLFEANGAVPLWTLKDDPLLHTLFP